jgi:hypothetical protein
VTHDDVARVLVHESVDERDECVPTTSTKTRVVVVVVASFDARARVVATRRRSARRVRGLAHGYFGTPRG